MRHERIATATGPHQAIELNVNSPVTSRVESLDVLRGLMALAVAVYHLQTWTHVFGQGTRLSSGIAALGLYSVEGFFIVSGFCFFLLYRDTPFVARAPGGALRLDAGELRRFHVKRFFRIAPLYYLAVALNLLLQQPAAASFTWPRLAENLSLTFGLFHPNHSLVLGGWSIGIEYVFYLAFPLLAWLTRRPGALHAAAIALIALAYPFTFALIDAAPEPRKFHVYAVVANHAFLFLLGGVVADLHRRLRLRLSAPLFAAALGAIVWIAIARHEVAIDAFMLVTGPARVEHLAKVFAITVLFALLDPAASWLLRPVRWLGDLSYSTYLLHPFAYLAVSKLVPAASMLVTFTASLLATLALAALSYHLLERPLIEVGRRLSGRSARREAPAGAPAATFTEAA
jgi:exopolysaccharide production protein ExoZ